MFRRRNHPDSLALKAKVINPLQSMRYHWCVCTVRSSGLPSKALRQRPIFANVFQKGFPKEAFPIGRPDEAFVASSEGTMGERSFIKGSIA
jgi:hypothetical protein